MPADSLFRCERCGSHISTTHAPRCPKLCIGWDIGRRVVTDVPFGRCTWGGCDDAREVYVGGTNGVVYPVCQRHAVIGEAWLTRCPCHDCAPPREVVCVADYRYVTWNHAEQRCNFQAGGDSVTRDWCQLPASVYTHDTTDGTTRGWCGIHAADMTLRYASRLHRCGCQSCADELPDVGRSFLRIRDTTGAAPEREVRTADEMLEAVAQRVAATPTAPVVEPVRKRRNSDPRTVGLVVWA